MATQFEELIVGAIDYAGRPNQKVVPFDVAAQKVVDAINYVLMLMNLTDQNWIVCQTPLTIDSGNDEFQLSASNYGRAIFAEITAGTDVDNVGRVKTQVPIIDAQDSALDYVPNVTKSPGFALVVWRTTSGTYNVRVVPPLTDRSFELNIWYEPSAFVPDSITKTPGLIENVYGLVKTIAAQSILGLSGSDNQILAASLVREENRITPVLQQYLLIDSNESPGEIVGFNSGRYLNE